MSRLAPGVNNCFAVKRWSQPSERTDIIATALGLTTCQLSLDLLPPTFAPKPVRDYAKAGIEAAAARLRF
jgi:hypothetical protein